MRYFFHIAYSGYSFNGWQRHPKAKSIQETIEQQLKKILKVSAPINGCGRTDAKVNASQFFFHVDLKTDWDFDLKFRINKALPSSITVVDIIPVDDNKHARFDAVQRQYNYLIHTQKNPFLNSLSTLYELDLNYDKMKKAVALLSNYQDYRAFCTTPNKYEHTICKVTDTKLYVDASGMRLNFEIKSNRFLTRMIRIIIGKLLKVGTNELSINEFEQLLINKETPANLDIAHPTGLYLSRVIYPFLDIEPAYNALLCKKNWTEIK